MIRILPFLILVFLIGAVAIATYNLNGQQEISSAEAGQTEGINFIKTNVELPEFSLPGLFDEKNTFSKNDLMGKYSLISFFASWCTTCKAQHNILQRLQSEKIIDIYGVAWRDIDENTKSYLAQRGNPFIKTASDSKALFTKITGLQAVPETWITDKNGNIVMRFRGNLQEFSIDEIKNFLSQNR
jgi:cytochrome c biogenesis protein CcmG/thiol:disulfide interchange protein DsbE